MSHSSISRIFEDAAAAGATAMRLYSWPVNASDPMWTCALDCATTHRIYVLPTIDGHTDWTTGEQLQSHASWIAAQVANETAVWGLDAQVGERDARRRSK
jgi:hypothetical protein